MRRGMELIVGMSLACGLLTFAPQPSRAAGVEKSLLGVRILQTYREVLKLYGAPTRVYRGNESVTITEGKTPDGDLTGAVKSLGESSGGGMPGGGGPGSAGMPGSGGGRSGGPAAAAGMPGSGGSPGGSSGGDEVNTTFGQSGGFTWAYYYQKTEKLYLFFFNPQGRLLLTLERGRVGGGATSTGVNLGSSLASVYSQYGWPDNVEEQANGVVLNYSQKHHVLIAVINGKVVGITVSLFEMPKFKMLAIGDEGGGGGGAPGGAGGPGSGGRGGGGGGKSRPGAAGAN